MHLPSHRSLRASIAPFAFAALASHAAAQIGFNPPTTVATGARAGGQVLADFDGDGDLDLAVTSDGLGNQDRVELFRNTGGTFAPAGQIILANGSGPNGLAAADMDGDGDRDLVVTLKNVNQVQVLTNSGAMTFAPGATTATNGTEPRQITAADIDADGDADVVVSNRDSSSVSVLRNTAGALALVGAFQAGSEARDHALGDFDGDGDLDVAVASHDSRQVAFLMNLGGGTLGAPTFLGVPAGTRPDGLAAADIDGDGDLDVVAGAGDDNNPAQNFVAVYRNNGGVFTGPSAFTTGGLDTGDVFLGDLDGDGDVDVVTANESSSNMSVLANLGTGTFGAPQFIATATQPGEIIGGDVDGNGSLDLVLSLRQQANVFVFENQAAGGVGTNYCTANVNSTGLAARISATGSASLAANNLRLTSTQMPLNTFGFFLNSQTQGFTANPGGSQGNLCVGGTIGRFSQQIQNSGATGSVSLLINLNAIPTPTGPVAGAVGQTWNFQCWFRDTSGGAVTSNLSNGLSVTLN